MTTDAAAIQGTFADFKLVKTRSVAQVIIEVPLEAADAALRALGGVPQPGEERHVAVARIQDSPVKQQLRQSVEMEKEKRSFDELPLSQQAGMLSNDPRFRTFLAETRQAEASCDEGWHDMVRDMLGVKSRAGLSSNPEAAQRWRDLYSEFLAWKML